MTQQEPNEGLVERLRKPTDAEAIYDHIIKLRKQTRSDLPRLSLVSEFDVLDEERREAADEITRLRSALEAGLKIADRGRNAENLSPQGKLFLQCDIGAWQDEVREALGDAPSRLHSEYARGVEDAARVAANQYRGHGKAFRTERAHNYEHAGKRIATSIRTLMPLPSPPDREKAAAEAQG